MNATYLQLNGQVKFKVLEKILRTGKFVALRVCDMIAWCDSRLLKYASDRCTWSFSRVYSSIKLAEHSLSSHAAYNHPGEKWTTIPTFRFGENGRWNVSKFLHSFDASGIHTIHTTQNKLRIQYWTVFCLCHVFNVWFDMFSEKST